MAGFIFLKIFLTSPYCFLPITCFPHFLCRIENSHAFLYFEDDVLVKNMPWHILAPAVVACDIYLIRRSVHPRGTFFNLQESNFL